MEPEADSPSVTASVGGQTVLRPPASGATVLFGVGPARAVPDDRRRRLERLVDDLAPAVHAVRWAEQVHGRELTWVGEHDGSDLLRCVGEADGLLTAAPNVGLLVWTADCVPVALIGPRAVAMVHAGWRGAAAGIAELAVQRLAVAGCPASRLTAYLGPAISGRHYQVGPEVIAALARRGVPESLWRDGDRVDLRRFLKAQLGLLGVGSVTAVGGCTFASTELASYRRDGDAAGRQWSMVWRVSGLNVER